MHKGLQYLEDAVAMLPHTYEHSRLPPVVMHQPPPDAAFIAPQIDVNGAQLQVVDSFTYLDITLFRATKVDDELARRIFKTIQAFGRL
ncbi:hypothetical protein SprV_0301197800 [Sparganum proliferum]